MGVPAESLQQQAGVCSALSRRAWLVRTPLSPDVWNYSLGLPTGSCPLPAWQPCKSRIDASLGSIDYFVVQTDVANSIVD